MGSWTPDPSLPREAQIIRDFIFIDIPLALRFQFTKQRLSPFMELGIFPSIYLSTKTKVITDVETTTQYSDGITHNINRLNLVSFASIGLNYTINDQIQVFGQPICRYHITPIRSATIDVNMINYGIELGLRKKLK